MLYQQIARNKRKTWGLLAIFMVILILVGAGLGYLLDNRPTTGIVIAGIGSCIYLFIIYQDSASLVMRMNHAEEIHEQDNPQLWHIVEDMALVAQVPMPRVYIVPDKSPNAFATGRDPEHSAVAVTTGLLALLDREELEGVLGHELSHVRNYDIRVSTIAVALVAVISFISGFASRYVWWFGGGRSRRDSNDKNESPITLIIKIVAILFVFILGPLTATLVQMALSRNREYLADASSVALTRNPHGLISALQKIEGSQPMKQADPSSAGLYFESPFKRGHRTSWFATHPATSDRISRLEKM
ncbi:MAG: zinc metalloprotease HtpX [Lactobacillus sp.]|nr:zinc metalloprotease HtpX [Lactobacillus sp.]MDN6052453.1 zinc metalloprotease HtpX [Lactobacillus sp.]